ncbi:pyrophosphatase PpaX [Bacillus methanolicus PB1]|uniref:Pyrophosphatase PpaX n=1 Tax=Bacillus methanolicus PB1 TaxID=997296 RepID=I3E263_BACMT|nr:pyrophosphatase PpaX [Bacillus methanolicus]EIJ80584.1 pyrophosphatase PpaX [Bacillus methanolicus PB1]
MNTKINTVLFDLDGTLIDTNELIISSFLHTLEKYYPGQYKRADVIPFMGPTLEETFEGINKDLAEDLAKTYREFNISNHDLFVKEFDGVYETVRVLKENGIKLGIVTTKRLDVALKGIKLTKLDELFDCLVAIDHVKKPKPDPEPILLALEQLQSVPEETLMVGDNHHDILAGKNAGTKTAGVAWSLKGKDYLAQFEPDYMLNNIADLLFILGV